MAMLIAWQTINAVRHPQSRRFTRGFLIVTPGITTRDRLRVLYPNDLDSYYAAHEITNFHAFKLRDRMQLAAGNRRLLRRRIRRQRQQ